MRRGIWAAAILVLALSAGTSGAAAHEGAAAYMVVASDFVLPGQPFQVVVADIGEDAPVHFSIVKDARVEALGSSRAAPDGHLMADLMLPSDFPLGYAQLTATVMDVTSTSTWVLVGERNSGTPAPPSAANAVAWWSDPSVIVLGVLLVGVIGAIGYLLFKPKRVKPQPVVKPSGPRRSSGKRSRR